MEQIPKEILRDMRRPAHFHRLDQSNQPQKVFKDLSAKMMSQVNSSQYFFFEKFIKIRNVYTQVNLSAKAKAYCSYSMFSNESMESLNTTIASEGSPCSVRKPSIAR